LSLRKTKQRNQKLPTLAETRQKADKKTGIRVTW